MTPAAVDHLRNRYPVKFQPKVDEPTPQARLIQGYNHGYKSGYADATNNGSTCILRIFDVLAALAIGVLIGWAIK